jgi:spermidine/putrescine transport system permease protein
VSFGQLGTGSGSRGSKLTGSPLSTSGLSSAGPSGGGHSRHLAPILSLPSWFWYLFFFAVPWLTILVYSFGSKPDIFAPGGPVSFETISLENYRNTFSELMFGTLRRTMYLSTIGTLACLLVAFPVAYWLAIRVVPSRRPVLLALLLLPYWTSFLLRTFAWRIILAKEGPLSVMLQSLRVIESPLGLLDTRRAVLLGVIYNYLPLMFLPLYVTLERLSREVREASSDLGAPPMRTFFQVTIPLAAPGIAAGTLLVLVPLTAEYVVPQVLGGARGLLAGNLIANQFLRAQNWPFGAAMAIVLVTLLLAVIGLGAGGIALLRWQVRRRRRVLADMV